MSSNKSPHDFSDNGNVVQDLRSSPEVTNDCPLDLDVANLSLLPHTPEFGDNETDNQSVSSHEHPYRLSRAPPPTIASAEPGPLGSPRSDISEASDSRGNANVSVVGGTTSPKDQPIPSYGVAEGSNWASEVEHTMERAFKMLKQLAEDDWKEQPEVSQQVHMMKRLQQMRLVSSEMNEALKLVEKEAYPEGKNSK